MGGTRLWIIRTPRSHDLSPHRPRHFRCNDGRFLHGSFMASTGLDCETLFVGTFDARSTEGIECTNLRTVEFGLLISGTKSGSNSFLSSCLEEYSEPSHRESCESDSFVACDARCKCASEQASTCWLYHLMYDTFCGGCGEREELEFLQVTDTHIPPEHHY